MNLVLINQYFPPDVAPTGLMLQRVAEDLVDQGHEVTILCAKGGYAGGGSGPESVTGDDARSYQVIRIGATGFGRKTFLGKLVDYAGFYLGVAWHLLFLRPRPDRFVALTTPPFLSVLVRLLSNLRGGDHAHWVMDLYPDVMVAHGMISEKGLLAQFLGRLARWGFGGKRCRLVLTLGPDMEERVSSYLSAATPRAWVPLWGTADESESDRGRGPEDDTSREVVLMYSGNMGLGHRFGEFLEAAREAGEGFQWKFHGQGKRRCEIEDFVAAHPDAPVSLGDYVERSRLGSHLATADVHLASLEEAWTGTMVPSKLQGIFAIGRPVIFVGSESGAIGQWIVESDGGWVVPPGRVDRLLETLKEAREPEIRRRKGQKARQFAQKHFQASKNGPEIAKALAER